MHTCSHIILKKPLLYCCIYRIHKYFRVCVCVFFFLAHHVAFGILFPQLGIETGSPALEKQSFTHWTTKEVPGCVSVAQHSTCLLWWPLLRQHPSRLCPQSKPLRSVLTPETQELRPRDCREEAAVHPQAVFTLGRW